MRTLPCVVLWVALVLAGLGAGPARGHHILGIPHYAYDENYPQVAFVEILAQSGPYDIRMSYMPGIVEAGARIRFKLYAVDRGTHQPFRLPLTGRVEKVRFGRSPEVVVEEFPIEVGTGPEGNDYKFFLSFPEVEAYRVVVRFPFPGVDAEEIPFPVQVGVTDDTPLLVGALACLVAMVVGVRFAKRRSVGKGAR